MTEVEMFEMAAAYISNAMTAFGIYLTIVFAYLATTYFVGKDLSRIQTLIISVLFVVAATVALLTFRTQSLAVIHFQGQLNAVNNVFSFANAPIAHNMTKVILPLFAGGILASLYFMWDVRHPKPE